MVLVMAVIGAALAAAQSVSKDQLVKYYKVDYYLNKRFNEKIK